MKANEVEPKPARAAMCVLNGLTMRSRWILKLKPLKRT